MRYLTSLLAVVLTLALSSTAWAQGGGDAFRFATLREWGTGGPEPPGVLTDTRARLTLRFARDLSSVRFRLRV